MIIQKNTNDTIRSLRFMGVMTITPEIAAKMLEKNFVNRRINKSRVNSYAHDMKNDTWGEVADGRTLQFDKDENLMNGQHRLTAIIASGKAQEMFIFQSDITSTSLAVPFDTGLTRSLSLVTGKSTNYVGVITFFLRLGYDFQKFSPAMLTDFEKSLSTDELEIFETIGVKKGNGFNAPVKAAFIFSYLKGNLEKQETINLFVSSTTQDYENPLANKIRDYIQKNIGTMSGGTLVSGRGRIFTNVFGIINQYEPQKYTREKFQKELYQDVKNWMKGRL